MPQVNIYNMKGEVAKKAKLSPDVFDFPPNPQVVSEVVSMYLANTKNRTASVKTKAEVRGGGRKPFRQKGTGRARAGSIRSPLFRGGGVIFGPVPRKKIYKIPKRKKEIALKSVLSLKLQEDKVKVVEDIDLKEIKAKKIFDILDKLKIDNVKDEKVLIVLDSPSEVIRRAVSNLKGIRLRAPSLLTALDVMACDWLVIEFKSLPLIEKRIA
jgi:large subunit ribosomal protein L4